MSFLRALSGCVGPAAATAFVVPSGVSGEAPSLARVVPPALAPSDPEEPPALLCLHQARACVARGELVAALGWFDHALALDPSLAVARFGRSVCLNQLGRSEEAASALASAAPEEAPLLSWHLARAAARAREEGLAMALLAEALRAQPGLALKTADDPAFGVLRDHPRFLQMVGEL